MTPCGPRTQIRLLGMLLKALPGLLPDTGLDFLSPILPEHAVICQMTTYFSKHTRDIPVFAQTAPPSAKTCPHPLLCQVTFYPFLISWFK